MTSYNSKDYFSKKATYIVHVNSLQKHTLSWYIYFIWRFWTWQICVNWRQFFNKSVITQALSWFQKWKCALITIFFYPIILITIFFYPIIPSLFLNTNVNTVSTVRVVHWTISQHWNSSTKTYIELQKKFNIISGGGHYYHLITMALPSDYHGITMRLPCDYHGTTMRIPCHYHVITMSLSCYHHITSLESLEW